MGIMQKGPLGSGHLTLGEDVVLQLGEALLERLLHHSLALGGGCRVQGVGCRV